MILKENYSLSHINDLYESGKRDPALIERVLFAFGLLEALKIADLPFIFKGGTSLMLILDKPQRLSTDIDILVEPGTKIDLYLQRASELFPFKSYEEQIRKGKNNIEKRHFKFQFDSPRTHEMVEIILDVVFESNKYAKTIKKNIDCELLLTAPKYLQVNVPDANSILADKLTAFAPHTTGILLNTKKDMEIMKQMFDIYSLINVFDDFEAVYDTYNKIVADEIAYRGLNITAKDALYDTYCAAVCVAGRGIYNSHEYPFYLKGIRSLSGHIYSLDYSAEIASEYAPTIMYMAACMIKHVIFEKPENPYDYLSRQPIDKNVSKALKSLKKRNPLAYAYSIKADELINTP